MNVIDKTAATGQDTQPLDLERFRLRRFIDGLDGSGEIEVRDEPVELAGIAEVLEGNTRGCAVSRRRSRARGTGRLRDGRACPSCRRLRRQAERTAC